MYYAAAATSILRAYGIPTRYVEGYVIRAKDTESAKRANRDKYVDKLKNYDDTWYSFNLVPLYEYNVKDTNGHAWVEVYINGLGWVPVEVTSSQLSESREQMELEQAISEIDNNPTMTAQPSTTQAPNDVTDNSAEPIQETNKPTKKPTTSSNEEDDKKSNNTDIKDRNVGIIVLIILLTALVLVLCIKRKKMVTSVDKDKKLYESNKMKYVYKMINYILFKNNIVFTSDTTYEEFVQMIEEKYPEYDNKKINAAIKFILKENYSESGISDEETKEIISFYNYIVDKYEEKINNSDGKKEAREKKYIKKI